MLLRLFWKAEAVMKTPLLFMTMLFGLLATPATTMSQAGGRVRRF
jgi:hypothetical protein